MRCQENVADEGRQLARILGEEPHDQHSDTGVKLGTRMAQLLPHDDTTSDDGTVKRRTAHGVLQR